MMLSFTVAAIWLLAMLAAAAHLPDSRRRSMSLGVAVTAFVAVLPAAIWLSPQPNWIGILIGLGTSWRLIAGPLPRAGSVLAGSSAALAAALQVSGGISAWLAISVAAAALLAAFAWAGRSRDRTMRELMLVVAALGAPLAGLVGDLLFGWQSASMLNRGIAVASPAPPTWAVAIVGLALMAGLLRGYWIKR